VDLTAAFVWAVLNLWDKGEERLLQGVEQGRIPLSMAAALVQGTDEDEQRVLLDAYESGKLTGRKLLRAKRLLEQRRNHGKKLCAIRGKRKPATADALVRTYKEETQRQRSLVKKARLCEFRLKFIVSAVKQLVADEDFVNLLRAEKLVTMPKYLAEQAGLKR